MFKVTQLSPHWVTFTKLGDVQSGPENTSSCYPFYDVFYLNKYLSTYYLLPHHFDKYLIETT